MKNKFATVRNWLILFRPFAFSASIIPTCLAAVLAYQKGNFNWLLFIIILLAVMAIHVAANITNEYFDLKTGVDSLNSRIASKILLQKKISPERAIFTARSIFLLFLTGSIIYTIYSGLLFVFVYALVGVAGGYYYTAPPLNFKYRCLGTISIFLLFGILLPQAVFYIFTGQILLYVHYLPLALLVTAIVHANNMGDMEFDSQICTLPTVIGLGKSAFLYLILIYTSFIITAFLIIFNRLPIRGFITMIALIPAMRNLFYLREQITKDEYPVDLDKKTALLHMVFGVLFIIALF